MGLGVLAVLGLVTYAYILPFLNKVVWGTAQLAIGIGVASVLLYILTSKKFWVRTRMIIDTLGEILFSKFIEMNPFTILQLQLDKAEKDREDLLSQNKLLQGQQSKLSGQLEESKTNMRISAQEVEICQKRLRANPQDEDAALALETATITFNNSKDFVDTVQPIYSDIGKLVTFTEKAYRKSGNALKNARTTIIMQKAKYDAVTAGSSAMKKALRAFTGDPEMNKAGSIALEKLRTDIANKVGVIRTTIKATSDIMNERDLRDAAKVNLATQTVESLNIDSSLDYTPSVEIMTSASNVGKVENKNKYLDYLK
jgi:hypothetical protein